MTETPPVLIHIGCHKTGSTWLQKALFARPENGFVPVGDAPKSLGPAFVRDADDNLLASFDSRPETVRRALAETAVPSDGMAVISNERLSGNPHAGAFDAALIARRIREAVPHARILMVIREQRSMILSCYFQYLKRGGVHGLQHYLETGYDLAIPKFSLNSLHYDRLILEYQALFGAKNVLALPYELLCADPKRFMERLCDFTGMPPPSDSSDEGPYNAPPAGLRVARERLRLLNGFRRRSSVNDYSPWAVPGVRRLAHWLQEGTGRLYPDRLARKRMDRLKAQIDTTVGTRFADSNTETARLIGLNLKENFGYT